ncbi:MAG: LuxR C-terminal-related transcriptional regulator [Nitrospiraceae bacterium]|nr:LuxR C-terminal-related transcriptional regulator [Nitrospiraceae bacterium]
MIEQKKVRKAKVVILVQSDMIEIEGTVIRPRKAQRHNMNAAITAKLKDAWDAVGKAFVEEPLILIDDKGNYWLNRNAKDFIAKREVAVEDLMEWLRIGSSHLQHLSYKDIGFLMMNLPGDNVVAILRETSPKGDNIKPDLTPKECEIIRCLIKGKSNKEIASSMKIRPSTVNAHLDNIYMKLGCRNRVTASLLALKNGLCLSSSNPSTKKSEH